MRAARERERKRLAAKGRKHREERKAQELSKRRPTFTGPVRVRLNTCGIGAKKRGSELNKETGMKQVEIGVKCMLDFKSPIQGAASIRSNTRLRRCLRAGNSAIEVSPRRPSSTMPMFSSAEYCFRVARRTANKLLGRRGGGVGFLSHLRSLGATMSQKSSVPQAASLVSWARKSDRLDELGHYWDTGIKGFS